MLWSWLGPAFGTVSWMQLRLTVNLPSGRSSSAPSSIKRPAWAREFQISEFSQTQ